MRFASHMVMSTHQESSAFSAAARRFDVAAVRRDVSMANWSVTDVRAGLLCVPVIAAWVFIGVISQRLEWAVLGVAGAVAVGFGGFQRLGQHRIRPMLITLVGMGAATWLGAVAGYFGFPWLIVVATLCGYLFGAITMLGFGAWWVGLQWMIGLLVYGADPAKPAVALSDALVVLAGGAMQFVFLSVLRPWTDHWFRRQDQQPLDVRDSFARAIRRNLNIKTPAGRYAVRVALAVFLGTCIAHMWKMPNGYWVPMTAAILLKPDLHETIVRGLNRLVGTLLGAGLITLIIALTRPNELALGVALLIAIWACFAVQRVHYALFATCITAYVVLLLSMLGLPEPIVALHRIEATLIGAGIALIVHLIPLRPTEFEP